MKRAPWIILSCVALLAVVVFLTRLSGPPGIDDSAKTNTQRSWRGYKLCFIDSSGRIRRPKNDGDTVSEGQAYAMLRSVWLDDKEAFDRCYVWTEKNLSRKNTAGDHLLAWRWENGGVSDAMPASDADVDYALSLLFAEARWGAGSGPEGVEGYGAKAKAVLKDILRLETYRLADGGLYLSPWILPSGRDGPYPVNPSYYSPAHFRIFHRYTNDKRWLELLDTTYRLLDALQSRFEGQTGVGLVPDWCAVDRDGRLSSLEGKSSHWGYEAMRVPFRVGLDALWFNSRRARKCLGRLDAFVAGRLASEDIVYCEYNYSGQALKRYESPASYACFYFASDQARRPLLLAKSRAWLAPVGDGGDGLIYDSANEYYVNSLAWLAEAESCGLIRNLYDTNK
jgi:endoglucanase